MEEKYFKNLTLVLVLFMVMGYLKFNTVKYKPIGGHLDGSCLSNKPLQTWNSWDDFSCLMVSVLYLCRELESIYTDKS